MSEVNHELFRKYMEESNKLEEEYIAQIGQEEYDAREHWVNNPLIKPRSKVAIFDEAIARAEKETEERIVELLDQKHDPREGDVIHNESGECTACELIALIKGENK